MVSIAVTTKKARAWLAKHGLLLLSDPVLPSLVTMIAGEPVKGTWWSHPAGNLIFNTGCALDDLTDDVTTAKLIAGKVTYVDVALWPALAGVGKAHADWQDEVLQNLGKPAATLLQTIAAGPVRTDELTPDLRKVAKKLEAALFFHAEDVHTDKGSHATKLLSWDAWAKSRQVKPLPLKAAQAVLEERADALAPSAGEGVPLPWRKVRRVSSTTKRSPRPSGARRRS